MTRLRILIFASFALGILLDACASTTPPATTPPPARTNGVPAAAQTSVAVINGPRVEREFRAAWVATVANIDWPSKPGLATAQQQKEAVAILDTASALHLNAIILQIRPQCDAFYPSSLEPWSYYLTGTQGRAPDPFYDPLQFWIDEAHDRGIELHVWFNPYRAHMPSGGEITAQSVVRTHPGLAKVLPDGMYWLDPGMKETQDHTYRVVMDVVKRYDIDGVHFDDYFYPYGDGNFPDEESWTEYTSHGGTLARDDWRRSNVNQFVERIYRGIKQEKPRVKFGISPFGIWRPTYPASITGFDQYAGLYADARLWLNKGWIDYWSPQLYWPINQIPQSFPVLLGWWARENTLKRNLWPGMIITRSSSEQGADEIINQIMIERGMVPDAPGHVHFSMKHLMKDTSRFNQALISGPYKNEALVPCSPWLDREAPDAPTVAATAAEGDTLLVSWMPAHADDVFRYVVYYRYNTTWSYRIAHRKDRVCTLPMSRTVKAPQRKNQAGQDGTADTIERLTGIAVSAVDRMGNESQFAVHTLK
ncbi:MAG TPA: family 10 glycosylhydrolase [Bacteroidota bacterium]|nr:family 10 glycosylhydrolase [Bacteroidota bacterium]